MSKNRHNYSGYYKSPTQEITSNNKADFKEDQPIRETTPKRPKKAKVTGAKLVNMRENPNKESNVIDKLKEGTIVEVGESKLLANSTWTHIKYNEKTGFMMSQFLKEI